MRAIAIQNPGGPEVLELVERPDPEPPYGYIRVRVHAVGVNRADLLQRAGVYPAPKGVPADIPGLEYAGVVDALGPGSSRFAVGDRVFGLVAGGAYADRLIVHEREAALVPEGIDLAIAGAFPEAFLTAYDAMVVQGRLQPGERVLVHAVGSGVGTAAVQIARALGCFSVGTSRTSDKLDRCTPLGLNAAIVPVGHAFAEQVRAATEGLGVDLVLDLVGGPYTGESVGACALGARIVVVGLTGGAQTELSLASLLRKRLSIIGTVMRARPLEEKIHAARVLEKNLAPLLSQGRVRPVIDRTFPLAEAAAAHAYVASNASFGKVLLDAS